jgi:hypothetical protein
MRTRTFAIAAAALVVVSMAAPALAATDDGLTVDVTQADRTVTIGVTDNGTAVANATVNVTVLEVLEDSDTAGENETAGNETTNETDASTNETVEETNETDTNETETNVSIGGTYETDANGTVTLDAPSTGVRVSVTATVDNRTASTTTTLYAAGEDDETDAFGQRVQAFVHELLASGDSGPGIGQAVSEFVTANNPGADNRPDHAGPPADAGPGMNDSDDNETVEEDDERGPPEHAGADNETTEDNATDDDDRRGPPEHAGPPN